MYNSYQRKERTAQLRVCDQLGVVEYVYNPTPGEVEVGGYEYEASLSHKMRSCLKKDLNK